jgi:vancomycin permeability regulator SanA
VTKQSYRLFDALARGLALFWGSFSLLNIAGELLRPGFDATLWWLDLRWAPAWLSAPFLVASSLGLLFFALNKKLSGWGLRVCAGFAVLLGLVAIQNTLAYYLVLFRGEIQADIPMPLSLFIAASLGLIVFRMCNPSQERGHFWGVIGVVAVGVVMAPLAQMLLFGLTDYQRPADAILVFGARAYADGSPSDALRDRILAACELYQKGLATKLILSGGPGDGAYTEPDVMKKIALDCGVPEAEIVLDPLGVNTQATVENTLDLLEKLQVKKVIAVSHFYHLPRIKMAFQRRGVEVFTSPAPQRRPLLGLPIFMMRESIALWAYYFMIRG